MDWGKFLIKRRPDTHKYDYGHILIIGGSLGLTGAVCLAAGAALRIGSGLVTVGVPDKLNNIFEIKLTEVMSLSLASKEGVISSQAFSKIRDFILRKKVNVLAVGAGLSNTNSTQKLVKKIIKNLDLPIVLDADGINAISSNPDVLKNTKAKVILTPHLGELSRIIKRPVDSIKKQRKILAKKFSLRYNLLLVLKGKKSIVTDGKRIFENNTGNPGMATAGSGDVLLGIIAGLIAQVLKAYPGKNKDLDLFEAVKLGVYLHGLAADFAAKEKTQACLIASDIIEYLPKAIKATVSSLGARLTSS